MYSKLTFDKFRLIVITGIATGELKISVELTDFDLAVYYAIGVIGEQKGYPCDISLDEIYAEIMTFAPDLLEENE